MRRSRNPCRPIQRASVSGMSWGSLFGCVFVCLAVSAYQGCARAEISWDSPRMLQVKEEWELLSRRDTSSRKEYEKLQEALHDILARRLSYRDVRDLAASCGILAIYEGKRSRFENAVLAHSVRVLVDAGDRGALVRLLSTRCPLLIYNSETIELYLACVGAKLKDPIMVLGEAYANCQVPEVRRIIAAAVRRGFTDLGIRGKDDAEFVKNAMQWYEKEKDHLVPNGWYSNNQRMFLLDELPKNPDEPWKGNRQLIQPLFEKKTGP